MENLKSKIMYAVMAMVLLVGAGGAAWGAGKGKRPEGKVEAGGCVTAECHGNIKAFAVVHAPVRTNGCDACHEAVDVKKHTFAVRRQKAELCTYCHEFSVAKMPVVHKPVATGECLGCHDPHGGVTKALTLEKTLPELCGRCHESVTKGKAFVHGVVGQGACDTCHPPHAAKFAKLLDAVGTDLCLACHKEMEPGLAGAKSKHKALEQGCQKCHDVHGSKEPMELVKGGAELCWGCHEKLKAKVASATVGHSAISSERGCMNCHAAHVSDVPGKLLSALPTATCLKCHGKEVKTGAGRTVAAVTEVADVHAVRHGEIKEGQCGGCHEVHGGSREMLLVRAYSPEFYKKFSAEDYGLCFGCHEVGLAKDEKTTKGTGFRNGERNLHFVHANTGTHDRNCRACHVTHAGGGAKLLKGTIQYGKWEMPMGFAKTATGGSCAAGCHDPYGYDREKAVATRGATTRRGPATARSEREDPRVIAWTTTDTAGEAVTIPDGQVTVLALTRAEGAGEVAEQLAGAVKGKEARVVLVVCGAKAREARVAVKGVTVVGDEKGDAAEALGVRGWPTALVLGKEGRELARVSGEAGVIGMKTGAYVEAAMGKASATQTATRPTQGDVALRQARDVRMARALLESGKAGEALAYLERSGVGGSAEVGAMRAEVLISLKRYEDAVATVEQYPAEGAIGGRLSMLKGAGLIGLEKWEEARGVLEGCVKKWPGEKGAWRLLGGVYGHEGKWEKAAGAYREAGEGGR